MRKQIKLIIAIIIIVTIMLSGSVMAVNDAMYNGLIKAISFGQHTLFGNGEPTLSINKVEVSYTKMPEAIHELIALSVITQNIPDDTPLVVNLLKDGIAMNENDYVVIDNIVDDNFAMISIMLDVDMNAQEYSIQVLNEDNGVSDSIIIDNKAIVIEQTLIMLDAEESTMLSYYTIPNMEDEDLIFLSENENVATIAPGGLITAIGSGETTITITSQDGEVQASCAVYVVLKEIIVQELTTTPETLIAGEEGQINVTISAEGFENEEQLDISIIKNEEDVTGSFVIEGNEIQSNEVNLILIPNTELVTSGEYTILVSYDGKVIENENIENQTRNFVIEANKPVLGLVVDIESVKMQVGETKKIQVTITPEDANNQKLIWYSDNEEVATVNEEGMITSIANGTAIITVISDENSTIKATINVKVQELVETEEYLINKDEQTISRIPENTTVEDFLRNISIGEGEYQFQNKHNQGLNDTDLIGTGSILTIGDDVYTLIVTGDTNGDGQITITDVSQVKLHFIGLELLDEIGQKAADTSRDGEISITDVSQIKLHFIGLEYIRP